MIFFKDNSVAGCALSPGLQILLWFPRQPREGINFRTQFGAVSVSQLAGTAQTGVTLVHQV